MRMVRHQKYGCPVPLSPATCKKCSQKSNGTLQKLHFLVLAIQKKGVGKY